MGVLRDRLGLSKNENFAVHLPYICIYNYCSLPNYYWEDAERRSLRSGDRGGSQSSEQLDGFRHAYRAWAIALTQRGN